jgi:cell division septation protein DedD
MATREDGEFELVLGNKQLFSILFIVICLFGVFFAIGFLAGRSTSTTEIAKNATTDAAPIVVDAAANAKKPAAAEPAPPPPVETTKAEPEPAKPEPVPPKPEPTPAKAPATPPSKVGFGAPPAGTYLQVAATRLTDAESMAALLQKNGLRCALAPSPKSPDLVRVLVGPLPSDSATADARETLKKLGIDKPYLQKY